LESPGFLLKKNPQQNQKNRCADSKEARLANHPRTYIAYWPQRNKYCLCYNERTKTEDEMTYRGNLALHRKPERG